MDTFPVSEDCPLCDLPTARMQGPRRIRECAAGHHWIVAPDGGLIVLDDDEDD